jgi:DNA-binding transcriptional MocR family regulator
MAAKTTRAERRELVERLLTADHERSDRAVARASGVSHTLVATVRRELVAAGAIAARPPRPDVAVQANGNLTRQAAGDPGPALKHGAWSERTLAELRTRHLEDLRQRFPDADESLLRVQAGRLS